MSTLEATRSRLADLIFDAFYAAGIGGSAVALFFLIADSLVGSALFALVGERWPGGRGGFRLPMSPQDVLG